MKKRDWFYLLVIALFSLSLQGQIKKDSLIELKEIIVSGNAPITKERITSKQLEGKNLGQDIPYLLKNNLSVVSTSDAGAGVGYTGLRIRGSDQTRINVTLNGVPINNAESQGPFWVNMPDIASSLSNLTIQRGVGTSTEGTGSFGASINAKTQTPSETPYFQSDQSVGSFKTHKHTFGLGTGKFFNDALTLDAKVSFIKSDGYIDRAFSDLFSYYVNGLYEKNKISIGLMTFGGQEKTYQAWNGVNEEMMKKRRTFNSCGAIYDQDGNIIRYYTNETDNYNQDHYHLYFKQRFTNSWVLNSTLFYTRGKGYYEEYKQDSKLSNYKLNDLIIGNETISRSDLIRRQWLDNNFYGILNRVTGTINNWNLEIGMGANTYKGYHYGNVIWAQYFSNGLKDHEYYRNKADKDEYSGFFKAIVTLTPNLDLFGDIQYRSIQYKGHDLPGGESVYKNGGPIKFDKNYNFINPKIGTSYKIDKGSIYVTYGLAQREPSRNDILENKNVKAELLHNVELGIQQNFREFSYSANWYGMYYINQLVLSGKINDVGSFIRENSGKSYRTGIELSAAYQFSTQFSLSANSTLSINKNINFKKETDSDIKKLGNTTIALSPAYIGNVIAEWKPIKNLNCKWMNQYVSSQYLTNEEPKNGKLGSYFISDMVFEFSPSLFSMKSFNLKLALNNIFNTKYENNGYYYDNTPFYYPQAGFNFLTGISFKF
ncbi:MULTISPECIES: TonB-dependent receptor [unclassified Apibacter]|uniref:TonB-dependent receptor n=1 Tax=unclassified Apibacter TaxID=2630820 RepID=UPI00135DD4DA|nr:MULTISPECIES: TonB-dependent receptor plug domain-containing protein [unclassified Apibacter]MXP06423.1 TonB-dependent receptor [Apibacter sp. B3546]MXP12648.1 TonB-dependent receptor [Apibacter sp. B3239]